MEILRVPSKNIEAVITVSDASTEYEYSVLDLIDGDTISSGDITSNASKNVIISLPSNIDGSYRVFIDNEEFDFDVVRPYSDPYEKYETASEQEEYIKHEMLARAIIDSIIDEGFYYKKKVIETTGNGSDYIPLWIRADKVLKFYENNVLLYDSSDPSSYEKEYVITKDKTAIIEKYDERINRLEGAPLIFQEGGSDIADTKYVYRGFPRTFDYSITVLAGYKNIPADIARAAELLIEDIACGKLDYYTRYINSYQTDQFKIQFEKAVFEGTGNILVDKILSKYRKSIKTIGVL